VRGLTSPGASLSERDLTERAILPATLAALDDFVEDLVTLSTETRSGAATGLVVGVAGLTAGHVSALWERQVPRIVAAVLPHVPPEMHGWYTARLTSRLRNSDFPGDAFTVTRQIVDDAAAAAEVRRQWVSEVREALGAGKPDSPWEAASHRIARTEATAAHNLTVISDIVGEGFTQKRWVTRRDNRVRPSHAAVDGQTLPLDQDFIVGGYSLAYPAHLDAGASGSVTVNCRCVLVGVP
jgi:hypothetical protein